MTLDAEKVLRFRDALRALEGITPTLCPTPLVEERVRAAYERCLAVWLEERGVWAEGGELGHFLTGFEDRIRKLAEGERDE